MKKLGETLLISEELLKLYSPISKNVGIDRIFPFIHLAQPYYIQPILGRPLMEELQHQIEEDTLTEENKALILKIAMPLAMWTTYLAVRGLGYSFTQKGVTKEKSENSDSLNEKEMAEYMLSLKNQAEMAQELLISYLCNCRELYPLWKPQVECNCDKYLPNDGTNKIEYKTLIYFPSNNKKSSCGCGKTPCESCKEHNVTDVDVNDTTLKIKEWKSFDCKSQVTDVDVTDTTLTIDESFPRQI